MKAYFIRATNSPAYHIGAWEGKDGKAEAEARVAMHNKLWPADPWYVSEEII